LKGLEVGILALPYVENARNEEEYGKSDGGTFHRVLQVSGNVSLENS